MYPLVVIINCYNTTTTFLSVNAAKLFEYSMLRYDQEFNIERARLFVLIIKELFVSSQATQGAIHVMPTRCTFRM